ncbi:MULTISPECIES: YybH family protein [Shewanella]|uniref:SgcJ/EcaC family oxidoreductase n=2 Tax=Shewanella TaxID=22 RepID=A0A974XKL5_9GAMM|nr:MULTISPECIES: SgcJ/EcaC family oxidoreductase [Shewanella]QSX30170.1 SgcJ/EcaC family oxidoreductase [Shewanella cyperi]QSX37351.1 SgcJ/EcaC family oxidoreductase [Shewanella sedimentimangrovi]QSX40945.1 SgcJ/EcaC family oxidoreductase [Shewanella cyperi]
MAHSTQVYDAIVAADQAFMAAFHQGNAAAVADLYSRDGQFLQPNGGFVKGRQAIRDTFQAIMDMGAKEIRLAALEVEDYGDTAAEIGTYVLEGDGGQVLDQGKFMVLWHRENGQWRLYRDMINSSMPAH